MFQACPGKVIGRTDNGAIRIQSTRDIKEQVRIEYRDGHGARYHRIPDSLRAFCRIVSLTVTKTSLMLDVSVAWVILHSHAG
jgi:hypothetical protein